MDTKRQILICLLFWGCELFQGADGANQLLPSLANRYGNTWSWLQVARTHSSMFKEGFSGIVLTGWSRYDHFATICELLPVGVPALAVSLAFLQSQEKNRSYIAWRKMVSVKPCRKACIFSLFFLRRNVVVDLFQSFKFQFFLQSAI